MRNLKHPHIIKYHTSFMEEGNLHILMEYAENGDLYQMLKHQKKKRKYFSEKEIWLFAYQILLGIEYMHS